MTDNLIRRLAEWSRILRAADLPPDPSDKRVPDLIDEAASEITRLRGDVEKAAKEITWGDIRLAVGEGRLSLKDVLGGVNVILNARRRDILAKLETA